MPCRLGRHAWVRQRDKTWACRRCGKARRSRKTVFCFIGLHDWAVFVTEGERYLKCDRCGKYGGSPGSFNWVPNRNQF